MAINAGSHGLVAGRQTFAVHAGLIQFKLVHSLLWPELPHEVRVAVALRAQPGDLGSLWLPYETLGFAHRLFGIIAGRIAAVAVDAAQATGCVNVILDQRGRKLQRPVHDRVTIHAGIFRYGLAQERRGRGEEECRG